MSVFLVDVDVSNHVGRGGLATSSEVSPFWLDHEQVCFRPFFASSRVTISNLVYCQLERALEFACTKSLL